MTAPFSYFAAAVFALVTLCCSKCVLLLLIPCSSNTNFSHKNKETFNLYVTKLLTGSYKSPEFIPNKHAMDYSCLGV